MTVADHLYCVVVAFGLTLAVVSVNKVDDDLMAD